MNKKDSHLVKEADELCKATYVMEDMVDRLYNAENNLEKNIKKLIRERQKVSEFENKSIKYFKDNGNLPEWYIEYKLGKRLTYGYNLLYKEGGEYNEDKNYSVGYVGKFIYGGSYKWMREGKLIDNSDVGLKEWLDELDDSDESDESDESDDDSNNMGYARTWILDGTKYPKFDHLRFDYDAEMDFSNDLIIDIFQNYFSLSNKEALIYTHEGCVCVKFINIGDKNKYNNWNDYEYVGYGTTGSIGEILKLFHKSYLCL